MKTNRAPLRTAAQINARNTFQFCTTSSHSDSAGLIWGFLQENQRWCLKIFRISHIYKLRWAFSCVKLIVSWMSFVVRTFPERVFSASFTASTFYVMRICHSWAQISFFKAQSSAFKTNCLMSALIFSGRMQNSFPISFGFQPSMRRMCKIAFTFPRKFFDSCVQGWAIYHILISGTFCFGMGASIWTSISWLLAAQKAASLS